MAFPYIGCKISLLSKHGIRYEGTLYTIDPNDSTIALSNVRCFGTEGRRKKDNLPEVEPAPEVFEYIIFKGNDIADLTVCDAAPAAGAPPQDPAIQATTKPAPAPVQQQQQHQQSMAASQMGFSAPAPAPRGQGGHHSMAAAAAVQPRGPPRQSSERLGTGELLAQRRTKKGTGLEMEGEFNFQEMNQRMDKTSLSGEVETTVQLGYKPKSSFFDTISCETVERQQRTMGDQYVPDAMAKTRKSAGEMRKMDMETFGETFGNRGGHRGGNRSRGGGKGGGGHHGGGGGGHHSGGHHGGGGGGGGDRSGDGGKGNRRRNRGKGRGGDRNDSRGAADGEWKTQGRH